MEASSAAELPTEVSVSPPSPPPSNHPDPCRPPLVVVDNFNLQSKVVFNRRASDSGIPDRVWDSSHPHSFAEAKTAGAKHNLRSLSLSLQKRE